MVVVTDKVTVVPSSGADYQNCDICGTLSYVFNNRPAARTFVSGTLGKNEDYPCTMKPPQYSTPTVLFQEDVPSLSNMQNRSFTFGALFQLETLDNVMFHNLWIQNVHDTKLFALDGTNLECRNCVIEASSGVLSNLFCF